MSDSLSSLFMPARYDHSMLLKKNLAEGVVKNGVVGLKSVLLLSYLRARSKRGRSHQMMQKDKH